MDWPFESLNVREKLRPAITLSGEMTLKDVWQKAVTEVMTASMKIAKRSLRVLILPWFIGRGTTAVFDFLFLHFLSGAVFFILSAGILWYRQYESD